MNERDRLTPEECEWYFTKMFGGIWQKDHLEAIVFPQGFANSKAYKWFVANNTSNISEDSALSFLAAYFGNSLWEVFSRNHTVFYEIDQREFSIGSWRGAGRFLADFIEAQNNTLQFDYLSFYMGHFVEDAEAIDSFRFIFQQCKKEGFNWEYAYPELGIIDLKDNQQEQQSSHEENEENEEVAGKQFLVNMFRNFNEKQIKKLQTLPTPAIIIAYHQVYGTYPLNWITAME